MQPKPKPQVYVDHIHAPLVSVREQAEVVVARLRELGEASFQELIADAPDTLTVVARFLALLELYRERAVVLDQEEALGALHRPLDAARTGAEPVVTDEFDQEPGARRRGGADRARQRKSRREERAGAAWPTARRTTSRSTGPERRPGSGPVRRPGRWASPSWS